MRYSGTDKHLEEAYCTESFDKNLDYLRICHVLSFLAFSSAGFIDYVLFPEQYPLAWTIRYGCAAPVFLVGLALTYTPLYRQCWQTLAFIYVLVTGLASLAIFHLMPPPDNYLYFGHIIISYMFGFLFVRIRFLVASLAGLSLFVSFLLAISLQENPAQAKMYNAVIIMLIMLLMGMYFAYRSEFSDRHDFFLRSIVEQEREKTASLNQTLENQVKKRTEKLKKEMAAHLTSELEKKELERKLSQAQKMEAIGTLAGGIAHDFNNILTSVMGNAELARMECGAHQRLQDYLEQVLIAANRAKELVHQILSFSRQADYEVKPVSLSSIATEVVKLMRASLPATIGIQSRIEQNLTVMADQSQLHQVLMNLCTNAWHAMQKQGGLLEVELEKLSLTMPKQVGTQTIGKGAWLKLIVRDSGCGIMEGDIDRIFEPFFTTKGPSEGTGMGLAVVYGIIAGHKGAISVQSSPGKGTLFEVYLPAAAQNTVQIAEEEHRLKGGRERILVVDDEVALVNMMSDVLSRLGYNVQGSTSSPEALELFSSAPDQFDLVITDFTMPRFCGDELARKINKIQPTPILLLTGYSTAMAANPSPDFGITAVMEKPILPWQLAEKVRQILDDTGQSEG